MSSAVTLPAMMAALAATATNASILPRESCIRALLVAVTDAAMAMDAADGPRVPRAAAHHLVHEIAVTAQTRVLKDLTVLRLDHDGLVEILERETLRMVIAVR